VRARRLTSAQELSNVAWSYGKLGFAHPEMCVAHARTLTRAPRFRAFADVLADRDLFDFSGQAISITLWGFAAVRFDAPALFAKAARSILSRGLDRFIPQEIGNVVWAFATAKQRALHRAHVAADARARAMRAGNDELFAQARCCGSNPLLTCARVQVAKHCLQRGLGDFNRCARLRLCS